MNLTYSLRNVRTGILFAENFDSSKAAELFAQAVSTDRDDHEAIAVIEVNHDLGSAGLFSVVSSTQVMRFA